METKSIANYIKFKFVNNKKNILSLIHSESEMAQVPQNLTPFDLTPTPHRTKIQWITYELVNKRLNDNRNFHYDLHHLQFVIWNLHFEYEHEPQQRICELEKCTMDSVSLMKNL